MSRLQAETARLYLPLADQPQGHVRALVLTLGRPAEWAPMAALWQAVQSELGLPAPAIAVSGTDSYQLWFSLTSPAPLDEAATFLSALCSRYLAGVAASRIGVMPDATSTARELDGTWPAPLLPGKVMAPDQWSAFVAADLAPMFAETPWLDIPPSPEGQAELLARLHGITPQAWRAALAMLQRPSAPAAAQGTQAQHVAAHLGTPSKPYADPRQFLTDVMNDPQAPLALRIEAAKALLPESPSRR